MAKKESEKYKLSGKHKEFVINKLALHCGQTEIAEAVKDEFDIDVTKQCIDYYKREYEEEWRKKREYFNKHIAEIEPFADKSLRVQKRGELVRDLDENLWTETAMVKNDQVVYDKNDNPVMLKTFGNHEKINKLLDSIHKELDPDKLALVDPTGKKQYEGRIILPPLDNDNGDGDGKPEK